MLHCLQDKHSSERRVTSTATHAATGSVRVRKLHEKSVVSGSTLVKITLKRVQLIAPTENDVLGDGSTHWRHTHTNPPSLQKEERRRTLDTQQNETPASPTHAPKIPLQPRTARDGGRFCPRRPWGGQLLPRVHTAHLGPHKAPHLPPTALPSASACQRLRESPHARGGLVEEKFLPPACAGQS